MAESIEPTKPPIRSVGRTANAFMQPLQGRGNLRYEEFRLGRV
jgi:hypothetical protein